MEITEIFEDQNASLLNNGTADPISLNMPESCPPRNAEMELCERKRKRKCDQKNRNGSQHLTRRPTGSNLPKFATDILKNWLESNCPNAYPTLSVKRSLVADTRLTHTQVNNWFINSRRRSLPGICRKNGLDYSKCKIIKRGGNKDLVLRKLQGHTEGIQPCSYGSLSSSSKSWFAHVDSNATYTLWVNLDLPRHQTRFEYLCDVIKVLEKHPNVIGSSRQELLNRIGLGQCL